MSSPACSKVTNPLSVKFKKTQIPDQHDACVGVKTQNPYQHNVETQIPLQHVETMADEDLCLLQYAEEEVLS